MVIQIDVPDRADPKKGDVLVFDGRHWVCTAHASAFSNENEIIEGQNDKIKVLEDEVKSLKENVSYMANALKEFLK